MSGGIIDVSSVVDISFNDDFWEKITVVCTSIDKDVSGECKLGLGMHYINQSSDNLTVFACSV